MSSKQHTPVKITPRVLFSPYIFVLIILIGVSIASLLNIEIQKYLPVSPNKALLLGIFFENPHLIASSFILLDREYLQHYKTILLQRLLLTIILCIIVVVSFGLSGFLVFFYGWTVFHVLRQQIGIGKMLNRQQSRLYTAWGWLFIGISMLIAVMIGIPELKSIPFSIEQVRLAITFLTSIALLAAGYLILTLKQRLGRYYLAANSLLLVTTVLCIFLGIPFLAILLPRFVHDATAYIFYVTHDTNRNRPAPRNLIYRYTVPYFSIWTVCIALSFSLAAWVTFTPTYYAFYAGIVLGLFHYTTESFTWKYGGLHRQYLHFKL